MGDATGKMTQAKDVAIFDLDHTISAKDTYLQFLLAYLRAHPIRFLRCLWLPWAVLMHKCNLRNNAWLKEKFLTAIAKGASKERIDRFSRRFVGKILSSGVNGKALERISEHRKKRDYLILSSASFDFYVDRLGRELGFDVIVCTRAHWDESGRLTGRIAGNNCHGEHKKIATRKVMDAMSLGQVSAYSDHHSDLPMFSLASQKVAVNPTKKLHRIALANDFSVEWWR